MRSDFLKVAEKNGAEEDGIMKKKGIINPDLLMRWQTSDIWTAS